MRFFRGFSVRKTRGKLAAVRAVFCLAPFGERDKIHERIADWRERQTPALSASAAVSQQLFLIVLMRIGEKLNTTYYILPCIANAFAGIASQARQTRSSMLEVIRSDYIVTARAKGLSEQVTPVTIKTHK